MRRESELSDHDRSTFRTFEEDIEEGNCLECHEPIDGEGYVNDSLCADCWVDELIGMGRERDEWQQRDGPYCFGMVHRREGFLARKRAREVIEES